MAVSRRARDLRPARAHRATSSSASSRMSAPTCATIKRGDRVIAPFAFSDGHCEYCARGLHTSCAAGGYWGGRTTAARARRCGRRRPTAPSCRCPADVDLSDHRPRRLASPRSPTSWAPGTTRRSAPGSAPDATVAGRGRRRRRPVRRAGARPASAPTASSRSAITTTGWTSPAASAPPTSSPSAATRPSPGCASSPAGVAARARVRGHHGSFDTAIDACRPGGVVGHVGRAGRRQDRPARHPHAQRRAHRRGRPGARYIPELLADVLVGRLDPSPVFDLTSTSRRARRLRRHGRAARHQGARGHRRA